MKLIVQISVTGPIGPATHVEDVPANRSVTYIDAIDYARSLAQRHHGPATLIDADRDVRLCTVWPERR